MLAASFYPYDFGYSPWSGPVCLSFSLILCFFLLVVSFRCCRHLYLSDSITTFQQINFVETNKRADKLIKSYYLTTKCERQLFSTWIFDSKWMRNGTVFVSPFPSLVADGVPWRKLIDKYLKGKEKKSGGFLFQYLIWFNSR